MCVAFQDDVCPLEIIQRQAWASHRGHGLFELLWFHCCTVQTSSYKGIHGLADTMFSSPFLHDRMPSALWGGATTLGGRPLLTRYPENDLTLVRLRVSIVAAAAQKMA